MGDYQKDIADRLNLEPLDRNLDMEFLFGEEYKFDQGKGIYSNVGKASLWNEHLGVNGNLVGNNAAQPLKNIRVIIVRLHYGILSALAPVREALSRGECRLARTVDLVRV